MAATTHQTRTRARLEELCQRSGYALTWLDPTARTGGGSRAFAHLTFAGGSDAGSLAASLVIDRDGRVGAPTPRGGAVPTIALTVIRALTAESTKI